ncbi:beta-L-arabinofuranosidase domain-containing protein [Motilibacter aurantiacus]|uniref:beta-L-arabinofuranosidase domain-containing protein n=1 Tax=Motilibacter aurantiacus TaxID=2714955 RepID=UPI00140CD612|nr:beta-L-arabinofuranosidase domain-containing protein [Motilibacter aurantiacus]NHC46416.1 glycosylase [Motilibacter aurantiacus]
MTHQLTRRNVLKLGSAAAVLPWVPGLAGASPAVAAQVEGTTAAAMLRPFGLEDVDLGAGVFADKRRLMLEFLRDVDERRFLIAFRANAGLALDPTVAPLPAGGWEGLDGEANGNLRGAFTGHFMSAVAQAYASTGEAAFGRKLQTLIDGLHEVRAALGNDPVLRTTAGRLGGSAVDIARGTYNYVALPAGTFGGLTSFTFAAWVRPTAAANWARILDIGNSTSVYAFLAQRDGNGRPRFAITRNGGGGEQVLQGPTALPVNAWSHVAVTLGGTTGRLYVNGVQVAQNTGMTLNPAALGALANNWLGRSQYNDPLYAGAYQDVNVWSTALTGAQVAELAAGRAATTSAGPGDALSLPMDETGGLVISDASGRGRDAALVRTWGKPSHPGFLAAYPETQFITLETMTAGNYTVVWAPYYTAHKILKGLLDGYTATGDPKALDMAVGLCDWMHSRLSRLTPAVRQRMWGIFSSGEFGGVVEAILETYGHSGKPEHLQLAKYFDLDSLIDASAQDRDILTGLHANQHIPIFTGALLMYDKTGEERYLQAARNFWDMVVPPRMFGIGGTSSAEFWQARNQIASILKDTDAETCCAYNMLKLTRALFAHEQDPAYMDYYERALFNQVLGSKQDAIDPDVPLTTYFIGLQPGAVRDYTPKNGTTCCEGTGMESATKYQDSVYLAAEDGTALYVNLFVASEVYWAAQHVTVTQETSFPFEQGTVLTVSGGGTFALKVRIPSWARGASVRLNGVVVAPALPGSYLTLARDWHTCDRVEVELPFALRAEPTPDDPTVQTLMYGPVNLVARDARTSFLPFSLYASATLDGDLAGALQPVAGKPLHFTSNGVELAPFLEGTTDPFHAYVRRSEPRIVLGSVDSGVANPARADRTTLLDDVWGAAPFPHKPAFLQRLASVTAAWGLSAADRERVLGAGRRAAFAGTVSEASDLGAIADAARAAGTLSQGAHTNLRNRLEGALDALADGNDTKALRHLGQYVEHAARRVEDADLRTLLTLGADALAARLRG